MMDFDNLEEHHLGNPAGAVTPLPSYDDGRPRLSVSIDASNDEDDSLIEPRREHVHYEDDCALWIGNVDVRISRSILFELFSQVGEIRNVSFPNPNKQGQDQEDKDEERASRFCFINFVVPDSVPKAIQLMQGTVLFGRELLLKYRRGSTHVLHRKQQRHQSASFSWVRKTGADITSNGRSFSPIRAPVSNPESSVRSSSSSGRRKVELLPDNCVDSPRRDERNVDSGTQPQPPQFHGAMMRSCRPHMQFRRDQLHQPRYYHDAAGMRPVHPHYNKHFQFNGGPRHPPSFPIFQHFPPPPIRPYGHRYEHPNNFRQPNIGYQTAPFRPRFDSYSDQPRYYNNNCQQLYDSALQSNRVAPELFQIYSSSDNRDREMQQRGSVRSRSRTRSRSRQSPSLRNYCREDAPVDQSGSGRKRRRSRTPSPSIEGRSKHKRRSVSGGSSCSYRSSYGYSTQRHVEGHRGLKRTRRSHSKGYASTSDDNKNAGTSRVARSSTVLSSRRSTSPSDISEYSDHGQKNSSDESPFSEEEMGDKNDSTTVSSSNYTAKKKLRRSEMVDSFNNSQESSKHSERRKSRYVRTPVSSQGTEREYDPLHPGY